MKRLSIGLAILVGLVAIVAAVGFLLPIEHTARREQHLAAPPDVVWRIITDVEAFPSWRKDVTRVERMPDRDGRAVWVEESGSDRLPIAVEHSDPPRRLVTRIEPGLPFGGTWTYEIAPAGAGSVLTITEAGEVYNPIFRVMSRFIFGHDATLAAYMTAIETKISAEASR